MGYSCLLSCLSVKNTSLAGIAQLVEQRTENPRVTGSSPVPGIPYRHLILEKEYSR
jgi:hypothetical protein